MHGLLGAIRSQQDQWRRDEKNDLERVPFCANRKCLYKNIPKAEYERMADAFEALADPNRRAILALLLQGERTAGALVTATSQPQPNVSKQLKVLRDAGLVRSRIEGPRRLYSIDPAPLMALDRWLADYRSFWATRLDALGNHLERSD